MQLATKTGSYDQEERNLVVQLHYWKTECIKKQTPHLHRALSTQTNNYCVVENKHK